MSRMTRKTNSSLHNPDFTSLKNIRCWICVRAFEAVEDTDVLVYVVEAKYMSCMLGSNHSIYKDRRVVVAIVESLVWSTVLNVI